MSKRITPNDLAYTGGLIDGEGYIGIRKVKSKAARAGYCLALKVHITNTNEWLIKWLHFQFGGSVYHHRRNAPYKDDWQWCVQTAQALKFLGLIVPYVKIKRPQAELAIQFGKRRGHSYKSDEERAIDEAQKILIQSYNRKGKSV